MFHFTYETTCLINGKRYIGKHSTIDLNDNYVGSSKVMKRAISKHGAENFERKIIAFYNTSEEAYAAEAALITESIVRDPAYYNSCGGGNSNGFGPTHPSFGKPAANRGVPATEEAKRKIGEANRGRKPSAAARAKMSATHKQRSTHPMAGKTHNDDTKERMRASAKAAWARRKGEML